MGKVLSRRLSPSPGAPCVGGGGGGGRRAHSRPAQDPGGLGGWEDASLPLHHPGEEQQHHTEVWPSFPVSGLEMSSIRLKFKARP